MLICLLKENKTNLFLPLKSFVVRDLIVTTIKKVSLVCIFQYSISIPLWLWNCFFVALLSPSSCSLVYPYTRTYASTVYAKNQNPWEPMKESFFFLRTHKGVTLQIRLACWLGMSVSRAKLATLGRTPIMLGWARPTLADAMGMNCKQGWH